MVYLDTAPCLVYSTSYKVQRCCFFNIFVYIFIDIMVLFYPVCLSLVSIHFHCVMFKCSTCCCCFYFFHTALKRRGWVNTWFSFYIHHPFIKQVWHFRAYHTYFFHSVPVEFISLRGFCCNTSAVLMNASYSPFAIGALIRLAATAAFPS